jgi:hypothetical protein
MIKKMTYKEFEAYAKSYGINVVHITRKMVYILPSNHKHFWWPKATMDHLINEDDVFFDFKNNPITLKTFKEKELKISAIKRIRELTQMSLYDSKNFIDVNYYDDPNNIKGDKK